MTKPESLNIYSRILGHRLIFMLGMNKNTHSPGSCWYPFGGPKNRSNTTECRTEKWKEIKSWTASDKPLDQSSPVFGILVI